jgi:hypothetical protein cdivTM_21751
MARKKGINNKNRKLKKKYIYFFMEGSKNCSEDKYIREYYNQFQDRAVDIGFKFISCGDGSWKNIEKEINKEKRNINDENIEIWCVLDKDKNDLDQINKECIKNNYKLVFSNCSFEVWLLYHYEDIKIGKCSQKNYENILTKKLNRKYKKNEGIKFSCEDKERAIKQSKKIHEKYRILGEKINNSFNCTNFYVILEKFNEVFNKFELE